jgi:hypothetical protein
VQAIPDVLREHVLRPAPEVASPIQAALGAAVVAFPRDPSSVWFKFGPS